MFFLFPLFALLLIYCRIEFRAQTDPLLFRKAAFFKVLLSFCIAVLAWLFCFRGEGGAVPVLLAAGLTFAVPADYFLQYIDSDGRRYTAGILCFAGMHLSLLAAFFYGYGFHLMEVLLFVFLLACVLAVQRLQKWKIESQRVLLSLYTVLVTLMASKAVSVGILNFTPGTALLAIGGVCFLISDIILGIWEYRAKKPALAAANRAVYFLGQIFFAYSLFL